MPCTLGHWVTLASGKSMVGQDLGALGTLRKAFFNAHGQEMVDTVLLAWDAGSAVLENLVTGRKTETRFDTIVWSNVPLTTGNNDAFQTVAHQNFHVFGDAYSPRDAASAIHDAYELALTIWH